MAQTNCSDRGRGSIACAKPMLGMKRIKDGESLVSRIKTRMQDAKSIRQSEREDRKSERENKKSVGRGLKDTRMAINYQPGQKSWKNYDVLSKSKNV